nr:PREDICTED: uncharacterized protein LOC100560823 isoform X2 [Anolis carolinensis]|eukprot:XP_008101245.1 PREDICTED: uncharacterized protein LOC100560823 isoform X2 [Anolis carolinensis]
MEVDGSGEFHQECMQVYASNLVPLAKKCPLKMRRIFINVLRNLLSKENVLCQFPVHVDYLQGSQENGLQEVTSILSFVSLEPKHNINAEINGEEGSLCVYFICGHSMVFWASQRASRSSCGLLLLCNQFTTSQFTMLTKTANWNPSTTFPQVNYASHGERMEKWSSHHVVCSPVKEMWKCAGIPAEDIIMSEKMLKVLFQSGCRKRCFPSLTSGKAESCPRRQALRGCTTKEDDEDDEEIYNKGQSACSERNDFNI